MERRLAAILAADVVGDSRLMGEDEAGTLSALSRLRNDVIDPLIAEHRGRVFKLMGDGILVEFASVVDAVDCAAAWQARISESDPERDLRFRIGVNLGDVIFEDGDIYGNGANVAARLEGPAEPGGIWREPSGESRFEGHLGNVGSTMRSPHLGPSYRPWHLSGCHPSSAVHPRSRSTFSSIEPLLPTCKFFSCGSDGSGYKIRPGSPHLREVRP